VQLQRQRSVVLCADYQGTRGDYIKADDTYKFWHFYEGCGAIGWAGDADSAIEFVRRFMATAKQFRAIDKTSGQEDADIRVGQYLTLVRDFVAQIKRERIDAEIRNKFGINLQEYYALDAAKRDPDIQKAIKSIDLGAEYLIVYFDLDEALFIRIAQDGYVFVDDDDYIAIGSGEPLATAIFSQIEEEVQNLQECLTWVYQAKLAAQSNPFVGKKTVMWVLLGDESEFQPSDEAWKILEKTPGISLAKVDPRLAKLGKKIMTEYEPKSKGGA
jgi:ATP-dependent protease HslVU (ClpYQ) peptidase subunit